MNPIHYIPILTTVLSALFAASLYRRWKAGRAPHLWWWAFGITTYGLGTAIESLITLFGNTIVLTKLWYVAGAILGGYPLAQGSLYLSWPQTLANGLTVVSLTFVVDRLDPRPARPGEPRGARTDTAVRRHLRLDGCAC